MGFSSKSCLSSAGQVLARRFRTLLCKTLRAAERNGKLQRLPASVLAHTTIEGASAQQWIVYAKPPFGGPQQVLEYLSRYTHRIAISNRRILSFEDRKVTFEWRDYSDSNPIKQMTLEADEFLRRFLMHVLPDRFVRIRYFGFLSNRHRGRNIELARTLLDQGVPLSFRDRPKSRVLCPACFAASVTHAGRAARPSLAVRPPPSTVAAA